MSAAIVQLPTAAHEPVVNPRKRGPYARSTNVNASFQARNRAREVQKAADILEAERARLIRLEQISIAVHKDQIEKSKRKLAELYGIE